MDGVVCQVAAGRLEQHLVFLPVTLQEGVLHEEEGPADTREVLGHVLHNGLGTLVGGGGGGGGGGLKDMIDY